MISKPQLKSIGSVVGIGGKELIRQYLTQQFESIGFKPFDDGILAFAKYKGVINGKEIKCTFSMLKRTKYQGINNDHQVRYRTFQGIRMKTELSVNQKTRLVIAKKTKGKWIKRISKWIMSYKKFKQINMDYLNKEVYSPDELFAHTLINDAEVQNTLQNLTGEKTKVLAWGIILIPEKLTFGTTFANLDDFETELLNQRFQNIINLAKNIENKPINQELELTKKEILARDNPKKLMWRGLWFVLFYILLCVLLIGLLFFITVKFGQWPIIIMGITAYIIYKKV
jgi:hypothetical protein